MLATSQDNPMMPPRKTPGRPRRPTAIRAWVERHWSGSHEDLAYWLEIAPSYIDRILSGNLVPGVDLAMKIVLLSEQVNPSSPLDLNVLLDPRKIFLDKSDS